MFVIIIFLVLLLSSFTCISAICNAVSTYLIYFFSDIVGKLFVDLTFTPEIFRKTGNPYGCI
jgi:hypothetical protein